MTGSATDDAPETKKADRSHISETQRQKTVHLLGKMPTSCQKRLRIGRESFGNM